MRSYILISVVLSLVAGPALLGCSGTANGDNGETTDETAEEAVEEALEAETGEAAEETEETVDAAALLESRCTKCHGLDKIEEEEADAIEWSDIVDRMIGKGADLDDEERDTLIAYLAVE